MKKYTILIFLFLIVSGSAAWAQTPQSGQVDRKQLQLRPNSKDYVPVRRNNLHQRIAVKEKRVLMKKARKDWKVQNLQLKNTGRKHEFVRPANRKNRVMINQQRMMMRHKARR
jgi:hypothetical protein